MRSKHLQFQINKLNQEKVILATESIAVMVFALFVTILLPSLLIRYVYANQQLLAQPKTLEYIPVVAFAIGTGYFLYVSFNLIAKKRKINMLMQELEDAYINGDCNCGPNGCNCGHNHDQGLAEIEEMVDKVMSSSKKSTKDTKKKSSKSKSKKK